MTDRFPGSVEKHDTKREEFLNLALLKISAISCPSLSLSFSLCKAQRLAWLPSYFTPLNDLRGWIL